MYASVVLFKRADVVEGEIISDERPLKSARKYEFGDHCIVLRVFETDGGFLMKATRNGLGGEVLFEGVVPDGQYTRVFDKGGSYWVVVISSEKIEVDATYQGVWTDEYGRLRTSERGTVLCSSLRLTLLWNPEATPDIFPSLRPRFVFEVVNT